MSRPSCLSEFLLSLMATDENPAFKSSEFGAIIAKAEKGKELEEMERMLTEFYEKYDFYSGDYMDLFEEMGNQIKIAKRRKET